ncbi:MAG: SDR family oxidoreductase [Deltaproteobacteria bacterium]|nr:SDR family oxidoreductase [Deltaproteobacteria bacterium]
MKTLRDRTALITGAASGIGRATAIALAAEGCRVALVDRDAAGLASLAERLAMGPRLSVHVVDVADRAAHLRLRDEVLAAHEELHLLINNAGVTVAKPFIDHSPEDFAWVVDVNLYGVVWGCHTWLPHLLKNSVGEAHIVNISSIFGVIGVPSQTSYCASKFAVRGFSEALAEELRGTPVKLTVVHPGGVRTGIMSGARADDAELQQRLVRFFDRKTLPPEAAAAQLIAGIKADKDRVLITREAHAFDLLKRLLPVEGNRIAVRALVRAMGMGQALDAARQRALQR